MTAANSESVRMEVDYNLDDKPESMIALLRTIQPAIVGLRNWRLDLSKCGYIGPYAGAIIVTALLEARSRGLTCDLILPTSPAKLVSFCKSSALEFHAGVGPMPDEHERHSETIPMRVLKGTSFSIPDPFIALISQHIDLDSEVEEYLRTCIIEVVQNVEDHSRSAIGAVAAARYMCKSKEIRIAIVDRGVGIGATVRQRYPEIASNRNAIAGVMEGGVSAKSRPNNMGVGVSTLCAIIQNQLKGRVFIISEDTAVSRQSGRPDYWPYLGRRFPGTAVFMNVPVEY